MGVVTLICFQPAVQSNEIIEKSLCVSVETTGQITKACNCKNLKFVGEWGRETNIFQNPQTQQRFACHLYSSPSQSVILAPMHNYSTLALIANGFLDLPDFNGGVIF